MSPGHLWSRFAPRGSIITLTSVKVGASSPLPPAVSGYGSSNFAGVDRVLLFVWIGTASWLIAVIAAVAFGKDSFSARVRFRSTLACAVPLSQSAERGFLDKSTI